MKKRKQDSLPLLWGEKVALHIRQFRLILEEFNSLFLAVRSSCITVVLALELPRLFDEVIKLL